MQDGHVTEVVRSCNYHIRALRHIRPLLTPDVAKMLAHNIITSRLDYANALLSGTTSGNLDRLQVAQNSVPELYAMHRGAFHQRHRIMTAAPLVANSTAGRLQAGSHHLPHTINRYTSLPDRPHQKLPPILHPIVS